jgi:hypothetical protein
MSTISGGAAGQHIALDPRTERSFHNLKIICRLQIHPVLRGGSEIPGEPHGGIRRNRPLAVDDGADPIHRNAQIACKLIQTNLDIAKVLKQDLAGMNRWKLFPW